MAPRRGQRGAAAAAGSVGVLPDDPGFDPSTVPVFPVARIELRCCGADAARVEGVVDGEVVTAATSRDEARQAVVSAVARRAQERPGQAIRAKGQDRVDAGDVESAGGVWEMVVTAHGRAYDLTQSRTAGAGRRARPRWLLPLASAGVLVVVAVVVAAVVLIGGRSAPRTVAVKPPAPVATQLPVAGPPGWSSQARWSAPVGGGSGASASGQVSTDGQRVFAPGRGSSVAAYQAQTGARVWSVKTDGAVQTGPSATTIDGTRAVVAATSTRFYAWSPATGAVLMDTKLPSQGAKVTLAPGGPMVTGESGGQHVWLAWHRRLVRRVLPAGATPITPAGNGEVLAAAAPGRLWHSSSDRTAGAPVSLAAPARTTFVGIAGASSRAVVGVYAAPGGAASGEVVLRAFARGSWAPLWTSKPMPQAETTGASTGDGSGGTGSGKALQVARPSGHWGVYGSSIVDLDTGQVTALPEDWQTSTVSDRVAFGTSSGVAVAATPAGLSAPSRQALQAARGPAQQHTWTSDSGTGSTDAAPGAVCGDVALLVAEDGHSRHLYAVPASPVSTSATATDSSVWGSASQPSPPRSSSMPQAGTRAAPRVWGHR